MFFLSLFKIDFRSDFLIFRNNLRTCASESPVDLEEIKNLGCIIKKLPCAVPDLEAVVEVCIQCFTSPFFLHSTAKSNLRGLF